MTVSYRRKLYFDDEAVAQLKLHARREHRSFYNTVIDALKRGIKRAKKEEGMDTPSLPRSRRS